MSNWWEVATTDDQKTVWQALVTDDGLDYYFNTETSETRLVKFVIYFSIVFEASFFSPSFFPPALIAAVLMRLTLKLLRGGI